MTIETTRVEPLRATASPSLAPASPSLAPAVPLFRIQASAVRDLHMRERVRSGGQLQRAHAASALLRARVN